LANVVRFHNNIDMRLDLCPVEELSLEVKEAIYRISQEAVWNTVKHAHAKTINLRLATDSDGAVLEVRDDGLGFDASGSFPGHLGLKSMQSRAASLGGKLEIASTQGHGTTVHARIPLSVAGRASSLSSLDLIPM